MTSISLSQQVAGWVRGGPVMTAARLAASPPALLAGVASSVYFAAMQPRRPDESMFDLSNRVTWLPAGLLRFHYGVNEVLRSQYVTQKNRMLMDLSRSLMPSRRFLGREAAFYHF